MITSKEIIYDYVFTYMHIPFVWMGKSSLDGLDSSAFVVSILKASGILRDNFDANSQHLFNILTSRPTEEELSFGSVIFYGKSEKEVYHCGFMLNDKMMAECGGGNSTIDSIMMARSKDARVRIRPYDYRTDLIAIVRPNYKLF